MEKQYFKKYLDAKAFAKKTNGKIRPFFLIGPNGGKNFKGYNVEFQRKHCISGPYLMYQIFNFPVNISKFKLSQ